MVQDTTRVDHPTIYQALKGHEVIHIVEMGTCASAWEFLHSRSLYALVAELVDALGSGPSGRLGRGGSSPLQGTAENASN